MFKVAIIGGEDCLDYNFFQTKCINILRKKAQEKERIIIYTLGDEFVDRFSQRFGIETRTNFCDWKRDGKNALKNCVEDILNNIDAVILFDDGKSHIKYIYDNIKKKNIPLRKITIN